MSNPVPTGHPPEGLIPRFMRMLGLRHRHQHTPPGPK